MCVTVGRLPLHDYMSMLAVTLFFALLVSMCSVIAALVAPSFIGWLVLLALLLIVFTAYPIAQYVSPSACLPPPSTSFRVCFDSSEYE